jgi:hypothetical protein
MGFLDSPHRETPENAIKEIEKNRFWVFGRFFCTNFSTRFLCKTFFCSVFELPLLRSTRKHDKTRKVEEKLTSKFLSIFLEKTFDMNFLQKHFNGVFELPLPRNAQKRTQKNPQKKVGWWVGGSGI